MVSSTVHSLTVKFHPTQSKKVQVGANFGHGSAQQSHVPSGNQMQRSQWTKKKPVLVENQADMFKQIGADTC
jgi:hypothetical protein